MEKNSKEPVHRDWIKLWVKECLTGTIREGLTLEQRGIWYDFVILAGNSRFPGVICANENVPLSLKRIGEILNIPQRMIQPCIKIFQEGGRIKIDENGCIHIVNWGKYQYSDYDRQKKSREKRKQEEKERGKDEEWRFR